MQVQHLRLGTRHLSTLNGLQMKIDLSCGNIWRLANSFILFKGASAMIRSRNLNRLQWWAGVLGMLVILASSAFVARVAVADDEKPWVAPDAAKQVQNLIAVHPQSLAAGAHLYPGNRA